MKTLLLTIFYLASLGHPRLTVTPISVRPTPGQRQQFTANLTNVTWSLVGVIGTIDQTGLFIATVVGTGTVVATSQQNASITASATVTVLPPEY